MKAKHTPGQWESCIDGIKVNQNGVKRLVAQCNYADTFFNGKEEVQWVGSYEEYCANARLIAAAPDLLAALKEAISNPRRLDKAATAYYIGQKFPITERLKVDADWYASILSAIEKADATYNQ